LDEHPTKTFQIQFFCVQMFELENIIKDQLTLNKRSINVTGELLSL